MRTYVNCATDLYSLLIITVIALFSFAITGLMFFGRTTEGYMTIENGLYSLIFFILGQSNYEILVSADLFFGRLFFFIVSVMIQYIIVNIFCSVLQEGFELTRYMSFRKEEETIQCMLNMVRFYLALGPKNVDPDVTQ